MCRSVTTILVLAALAAASAFGAQSSTTMTHRKASGTRQAHHAAATERAAARVRHRAAPLPARERKTGSKTIRTVKHRLTADEVGRAAGLKIRSEMARQAAYRHRERSAARYRRGRTVEASRLRRAGPLRASYRETSPAYRPAEARQAHLEEASEPSRSLSEAEETESREQYRRQGHTGEPRSIAATAAQPEGAAASTDQPASSRRLDEPAISRSAAGLASAPRQDDAGAADAPEGTEDLTGSENDSAEDGGSERPAASDAGAEEASLYIPRGAMPPPLRGSLASLERQNERLTSEGLERIEDEDDLAARIADGLLVPVPVSAALTVNSELPLNHRYCRPWTARFLTDLARAHEALFHRPLEVSSAVRTVAYQKHLMGINGNAAPAVGDVVSPHLTGATIDIAKEGFTREEMGWMRNRLLALEAAGKIDVEEEFRQACFHITVYKNYAPTRRILHPPSQTKSRETAPEENGGIDTQGQ